MNFDREPSQDLGLQHLLQNGLIVLRDGDLGQERTTEVIEGLLEIVSEADRGSEALRSQNLTFALENSRAFERFSLFFRYLQGDQEELSGRLANARRGLEILESGGSISLPERNSLESLLDDLLQALKKERALAPLHSPREIHFH